MRRLGAALLALAALAGFVPAAADASSASIIDRCTAQTCVARLTPAQLLGEVQALVDQSRWAEARPLLAALQQVPGFSLEYRFLSGFVAAQTGDLERAAGFYRAILTDDPKQTRVRLELARVMMLQGKRQSAERQFRIAEDDEDLPPEIARTIRAARDVLRSQKMWSVNIDAGIAPDSNINNATSSDQINVYLGGQAVPLTLNESARARSGLGRTGSVDASLRLPAWGESMALFDLDAIGTDYDGKDFDDYAFEGAAGVEMPLSPRNRLRVQAVGAQRLYGGRVATRQAGLKGGLETMLSRSGRLGVQLDARRTFAAFDDAYSGWQVGAYATYERAVARAVVASGGVFGRRDSLKASAYSSTEGGVIAGIGGELPHGINAAFSATASRAVYDAPMWFFSAEPRRDWRYSGRVTLGVRALRVMGLSPSVSFSVSRIDSNLDFYTTTRGRFRFALARYF